jgi:hypothetical protein
VGRLDAEERALVSGPIVRGHDEIEYDEVYPDLGAAIEAASELASEVGFSYVVYVPVALVRAKVVAEVVPLNELDEEELEDLSEFDPETDNGCATREATDPYTDPPDGWTYGSMSPTGVL